MWLWSLPKGNPNRRTVSIREVEEIQAIQEEGSEEEYEEDDPTLVTPDVGAVSYTHLTLPTNREV